jgi:hypothetical protein
MVRGKVMLIAIGLLLGGIALRFWLGSSPAPRPGRAGRPQAVTQAAPEAHEKAAAPDGPVMSRPDLTVTREELEALSSGPWGRNPFLTPDEEAAHLGQARPADFSAEFAPREVRAILMSEGRRIANIDGHVVAEGDLIGKERVIEIRPHAVVLGHGKRTRTIELMLPAAPIRATPAPVARGVGGERNVLP